MNKSGPSHSIAGNWRGVYYYNDMEANCAFEAVFIENDGHVEGNILDDCRLGDANVIGYFGYPSISFNKTYSNFRLASVRYLGAMSEDGKSMTGTWAVKELTSQGMMRFAGTWKAYRSDGVRELAFDTEAKLVQTQNSSMKNLKEDLLG